jgi:hypothetical protein
MIAGFTTAERDYIRRNLDQFLDLADGGRRLPAQDLA